MTGEERQYYAYLLRLWRVETGARPVWHASLEDPHTGERKGFANLNSLFDFLIEQMGTRGAPSVTKRSRSD